LHQIGKATAYTCINFYLKPETTAEVLTTEQLQMGQLVKVCSQSAD